MNIIVSNSSDQPIYDQVASQVKNLILSGNLREGEALPSMRLLAKELRISVITTKRAYEELEREGFIHTVVGKGSFVAEKNLEFVREEYLRKMEEHIEEICRLAKTCGVGEKELMGMLEIIYKENEK